MPLVDEVWGRMEFRTPWSRAREREAVDAALARFVAWHQRPGARTVVATEPRMPAEVTLPDGQVVRLHGYADRLELDEDGRVVVVDLKTSKYAPPTRTSRSTPSSASTSSRSTTGQPTSTSAARRPRAGPSSCSSGAVTCCPRSSTSRARPATVPDLSRSS